MSLSSQKKPEQAKPFDEGKVFKGVINLMGTAAGRDNISRLMAYSFGFFAHTLKKLSFGKETEGYGKLRAFGGAFANLRKLLRFFKHKALFLRLMLWVDKLKKTSSSEEQVYIALKITSEILNFFYFLTDHLIYIQRLGAFSADSQWYQWNVFLSDFIWFIQTFVDGFALSIDLKNSMKTKDSLNTFKLVLSHIQNVCDSVTAFGFSYETIPMQTTYLAGVVSTLITLYKKLILV